MNAAPGPGASRPGSPGSPADGPASLVAVAPTTVAGQVRARRGFYAYAVANHSYIAVIGTVLYAPYLTSVAQTAACGYAGTPQRPCEQNLSVLGVGIAPASLVFYAIPIATVLATLLLPTVGAVADRLTRPRILLAALAFLGSAAAVAMFAVTGGRWQLGVALLLIATVSLAASEVVSNGFLHGLSDADGRDRVSSRGWASGYVGSTVSLAIALGVVSAAPTLGLTIGVAVRVCFVFAGLWWAGWTLLPLMLLPDRAAAPIPTAAPTPTAAPAAMAAPARSRTSQVRVGRDLVDTFRDLSSHRQTFAFLLAALFVNDGVATVIGVASTYGSIELGLGQGVLLATILVVQVVAVGGALAFGAGARRVGARRMIQLGLLAWILVVLAAFALPAHRVPPFVALGVAIGLVLGGVQALTRSAFSHLVPPGRESSYFSLYQATEQGTSWLGTLVFGLVRQLTGSYRPALVALLGFFVVALVLLRRVNFRAGIAEVGNPVPRVI